MGVRAGGRARGRGPRDRRGFVRFDYEITLLTVRHAGGTSFCAPIGHLQIDGDYRESWQPQPMSAKALDAAQHMARTVTDNLGGAGIFGVELFVQGDECGSARSRRDRTTPASSRSFRRTSRSSRCMRGPSSPAHPGDPAERSGRVVRGAARGRVARRGVPRRRARARGARHAAQAVRQAEVKGRRRMGVTLALGGNVEQARDKARRAATALVAAAELR